MIKVQDENNIAYISFDEEYLTKDVVNNLKIFLHDNIKSRSVAVDLKGVESAQNDFFLLLKEFSAQENFSLCNVGVDINLLINLMNYRKDVKIYSNKEDLANNKRLLVHRNFKLC